MRLKQYLNEIIGYRFSKGNVGTRGFAGTFYSISSQNRGEKEFNIKTNPRKTLVIPEKEAEAFSGLPAEAVLYLYKDSRKTYEDFKAKANKKLESGQIMDLAVAYWAKNKGYDVIVYEGYEIQDLRTITNKKILDNLTKG